MDNELTRNAQLKQNLHIAVQQTSEQTKCKNSVRERKSGVQLASMIPSRTLWWGIVFCSYP